MGIALVAGIAMREVESAGQVTAFLDLGVLVTVMIGAPLLAIASSWVPALAAARQDPAVILSEE